MAHVLYLEQPKGVGFSYCVDSAGSPTIGPNACNNTDHSQAVDTVEALSEFFESKFPEFADKEFYISGESYAGTCPANVSLEPGSFPIN